MKLMLENKQLFYLFLCTFAIVFIGFGLFPLLPLHAAELGASPAFIGVYLAITYIAISLGSGLAGQLSARFSRSRVFIVSGLLGIPALILLGQARALWQVVLLTALVWFTGGIGLSISNVLTGLQTAAAVRGRAFGNLALASPLGALTGGLLVGRLVEWGGYPLMFAVLAGVWALWPALALTRVRDVPEDAASPGSAGSPGAAAPQPGAAFLLLLVTVLLASMTVSIGRMGLSLEMKALHFSVNEISTANAVGGLLTLPLTLMTGAYSDRLGRRRFLALGYLVAAGGAVLLIGAQALWQFWVASALVLAARNIISAMSPAYAADLLRRSALGKALPLVNAMNWASGVLGFAGAGVALDRFGPAGLYGTAALMAFIGMLIVSGLPAALQIPARLAAETGQALQTTGD